MAKRRITVSYGEKYGRLTVIREAPPQQWSKYKIRMVLCSCDCGKEKVVRLEYLRCGHTKSCGCNRKLISAKVRETHGESGTRLHGIWSGMLARCRNKNRKSYKHYGAIGISVCYEWLSFENFQEWSLANGYKENLTIERIDTGGNYEPSNCKWITKAEQARNKRNNRLVSYRGETKILVEWSEELQIDYNLLQRRLSSGWSTEKAFNTPVRGIGGKVI